MTDLHRTLYNFWASFGLPAWHQDTVPEEAPLPYITFQVASGEALSATILSATAWFRDEGQGVNAQIAAVLDQIAAAVPNSGTVLKTADGYMALYRNSGTFQSYVQDETDKSVIGGRTALEVHFYR